MDSASVAGDLVVTRSVTIPAAALRWRFSRSGGPGGQGVNTTDSRVELTVLIERIDALTESQLEHIRGALAHRLVGASLVVAASEHRSQLRNREAARERAAYLLREALATPPHRAPRKKKPSKAAKRRRLEAKKRRSTTKALRRRPDY